MSEVSINKAISELSDGAIGYVLSPVQARWFRMRDGVPVVEDGSPLVLDRVYHLAAFDGETSVRWELVGGGVGSLDAMILSDAEEPGSTPRQQRSLLWGTAEAVQGGWATLSEDRIPSFSVPIDEDLEVKVGDSLVMVSREIVVVDDHGNTQVSDVRHEGIEVAS